MESIMATVPKEFKKIAQDFIADVVGTFPEYKPLVDRWWDSEDETKIENLYAYCLSMYPENMMNILYQKEEIFGKDSTISTEFLPGISFKYLWNADISEKTKETLWKYLQLMLMTLSGSLLEGGFSDSGKLFENVNEEDFKKKWEETIDKIEDIFEKRGGGGDGKDSEGLQVPSASQMYNNLSGMMDGKLGQLAKEIAEDALGDFNMDLENVGDAKDLMKTLFSNPSKMMNLVKTVSDKLDSKLKSGDINQSELFEEATGMLGNMKDIPGLQGMMESLGGKGGKLDLNAMENKLAAERKKQETRDRMRKNLEKKKASPSPSQATTTTTTTLEKEWNLDEILESLDWKDEGKTKPAPGKKNGKKGKKV
jgi:hypothetical protein